ncbi:MAG: DEAD/DEAH box helicase family protein [Candidatus Heimdallarchaeota archaeon]
MEPVYPLLQKMVENLDFDTLPSHWRALCTSSFSKRISLYGYQLQALKNIIRGLYLFFKIDRADKSQFYYRYLDYGLTPDTESCLNLQIAAYDMATSKIIQEYLSPVQGKVLFQRILQRAAFWMATGSGKTLVIIKLVEILKNLMDMGEIPEKDILILTHRDDLLTQIMNHVNEFNTSLMEKGFSINLTNLQNYENLKREGLSPFLDTARVFYYRSDLIGDDQKEKIVDFRNYDINGNWYLILDEAHKGDKNESKRQLYYSILSRNGFLFNFSATFVDPQDMVTTVYNFNLEKFITRGYGKHLLLLQDESDIFREKSDFNSKEKQKIVLKALILLTYIKKIVMNITQIREGIYWEPLMLTLVNTVNLSRKQRRPDLIMFFKEIEDIAKGDIDSILYGNAINELIRTEESHYLFEDTRLQIDCQLIKTISIQDILFHIFNSTEFSAIEVITIPDSRKEVIFKLKSTDKPFALIKIGDVTKWIKENLPGYEIIESYDDRSIFSDIENRNDISLLMGSRAFYEGWDSNRPNLIMFINIGRGIEARKFVMQSIGRGVRVEPIMGKRRRLKSLYEVKKDNNLYPQMKNLIEPLETLFIFGTNREILKQVFKTLKIEKKPKEVHEPEDVDVSAAPKRKKSGKNEIIRGSLGRLEIPESYFRILSELFQSCDDRILISISGLSLNSVEKIRRYLQEPSKYFLRTRDPVTDVPPRMVIKIVVNHFREDSNDFL